LEPPRVQRNGGFGDGICHLPVEPPPRGKERILFVDDETLIVDSVRSMLERLGYTVTAVTDSTEALRIFSEDPFQFDLVVTDHTMPMMTGEDLGKKIMSIRPDIPVILCSGFNDLISPENARAEGFREFVRKPFSMREGAQMIRRVLDQKPLTRK
jgi:two-component system, cell cycle sensor histidine kinase and response regulator CckA